MPNQGRIIIKGVIQGVGFRPYVYSKAIEYGISGTVLNAGSEVIIDAWGERFDTFLGEIEKGTPLSVIDSIKVIPLTGKSPQSFSISSSLEGARSGIIPPDIATCDACVRDIFSQGGRYEKYFGTSCVNCGPRYSIIRTLPYDRVRTAMEEFPPCAPCQEEYTDPTCRRHHAQTIACETCGPALSLHDSRGTIIRATEPLKRTAELLDADHIIAIRGIGGFHIACNATMASELKRRLGRTEQPFAVMAKREWIKQETRLTLEEEELLTSDISPISVLDKRDPDAYCEVSNLHTIGCMVPYTGLHHLLFAELSTPFLIMTSANAPGYPMITSLEEAIEKLSGKVDIFLSHNREIVNRCDDSVVRKGYIIRLSRGFAPKRTRINLGPDDILGTGPELNATVTLYHEGFCITSPHVGNVRNPGTYAYHKETIACLKNLMNPDIRVIAHDLHPQFLSTRFAKELGDETGAELVPVQHHIAHIAATCTEECVGIAIDGVGYGSDGTIWGGEVFQGTVPELSRVGHLLPVLMPGGDQATLWPERMLYGILPDEMTKTILANRGWTDQELSVMEKQVERRVNTSVTTSTGRVLDAAAALLGICRKKTYDGEPAMRLESTAYGYTPDKWDLPLIDSGGMQILDTAALLRKTRDQFLKNPEDQAAIRRTAASFQYNLARGIATIACSCAQSAGIPRVALSGGVAYNESIRETIRETVREEGLELVMNRDMPLGDGCISYGQCVFAGLLKK